MSEEERRRIAASGGGFIEGVGAVPSERASKDYKEAVGSIETSGKLGVWSIMLAYVQKLTDFANDPRLQVVMDFLELFGKFLKAASSEEAGEIAELLYKEENIDMMDKLAKSFKTTFEDAQGLNLSMLILTTTMDQLGISIEDITTNWTDFVTKMGTFPTVGANLGTTFVNSVKKGFTDALEEIDWEDIIKDIIEDAVT